MIDVDVVRYPVELLYGWKHQAEAIAKYEYEGQDVPLELLYSGYNCPYCETFVKEGITFCKGCHADICYGLTPKEKGETAKSWGMVGLGSCMVLFMFVPEFLNGIFGFSIQSFFGNAFFSLGFTAVLSFLLMIFMPEHEHKKRLKENPRFFKARSY
ncbi:hypothetical protein [Pseudoalteromonas fuliginea]|uniref:hypothetical protein n=2 Tax=Pseudoalteromonas TaxID=53246 RepID=UPI0021D26583|nr:hypothetical protein [Pseudoalteromonas fuliginea]